MNIIKKHFLNIYILSENLSFRNTLAGKLRMGNFDVEFASGGFHILHILERNLKEPCVIILNEEMHDMPASEIISLIRLQKSKLELPILFISKSIDEEEVCDFILNGANEYIVQTSNYKPIVESVQKYYQLFTKKAA